MTIRKPNRVTTPRRAVLNGTRTSHSSMPRARGRWRPDGPSREPDSAPEDTALLRDVKDLITADVLERLAAGEPFDGEVLDPDPLRIEVVGKSRLRLQLRIIYDDGRLPRYFNVTEVP